ncbi:Gag-Pol polyprotein [Gossypium australe]|uniref:Gag-Pol polyprotein n=1 Tax=Gossypium australe TaxID=47621 RepID=A0A5B6VXR2_9ROSI|nr:Gag-Pol polyprotein [Gossypium australe]
MDLDRAIADDVESNAPAPAQGTAPATFRPNESSEGGVAKQAFFRMMSEWSSEFIQTNPSSPQPRPPQVSIVPQVVDPIRLNKPPVDKIRKYRAKEFRATANDDAERAEFWLENTIRVLHQMSLTPDECIKCAVSLLKDTAESPGISFKSSLERSISVNDSLIRNVKSRWSVTEYEQEFVRLSQYAWEYVSTEAIMCKRFIEGLDEYIKLLVGILDINKFVVLVERACKAEELSKEKKKADSEACDERKRSMSKISQSSTKRFRDTSNRSHTSFGHPNTDRVRLRVGRRTQAPIESSVDSTKSNKPEDRQCGR